MDAFHIYFFDNLRNVLEIFFLLKTLFSPHKVYHLCHSKFCKHTPYIIAFHLHFYCGNDKIWTCDSFHYAALAVRCYKPTQPRSHIEVVGRMKVYALPVLTLLQRPFYIFLWSGTLLLSQSASRFLCFQRSTPVRRRGNNSIAHTCVISVWPSSSPISFS